ncbi:hypothetical protein [Chondromyces apiculatus]|uniref:Uncharacterized protein n=1 Tax=Chondromyces apiculatus DSM 436 TaxID=1192034 RepID=A0A017SUL8_9BACT|nr:hypothetical protein [Chondromyces apiculatus]EYF00673.1 Hypothetical protein CAP_0364 [Chondromyces apiculatus DSM 436]
MAIQSSGEFEIIMNSILMRLDRALSDQPNNSALVRARLLMNESIQWARKGAKISPMQLKNFSDVCDSVRENFRNDTQLSDKFFDLLDFLEYRLG